MMTRAQDAIGDLVQPWKTRRGRVRVSATALPGGIWRNDVFPDRDVEKVSQTKALYQAALMLFQDFANRPQFRCLYSVQPFVCLLPRYCRSMARSNSPTIQRSHWQGRSSEKNLRPGAEQGLGRSVGGVGHNLANLLGPVCFQNLDLQLLWAFAR
ncbi:hypothetical protein N657DRAFT_49922 [Parathielavia appendiculata]|uniref:Uncharacterized protein n=1 Tax=Parathielavia appendiculata TaxID=2587402 RepID=A0AAN6Z8Y8_9PEZI|nr:hypothetical protein N657DRAFT_49922 [Parathielavia appendiculata]